MNQTYILIGVGVLVLFLFLLIFYNSDSCSSCERFERDMSISHSE